MPNNAKLSVNFSESSEAIRSIIQQVQQLATAVRGVSQEFASVFATMGQGMGGAGGMGMQTSTGAEFGQKLQLISNPDFSAVQLDQANRQKMMNALSNGVSPMYGGLGINPLSSQQSLGLTATALGNAPAQEGAQRVAFNAANMSTGYSTAMPTYQASVSSRVITPPMGAGDAAINFATPYARQAAEIEYAKSGRMGGPSSMTDVYKAMNTDTSSLIAQSQASIERLGKETGPGAAGSAAELQALITSIESLKKEINSNSDTIRTATSEEVRKATESRQRQAAGELASQTAALVEEQKKVGGGGGGGGGGLFGGMSPAAGVAAGTGLAAGIAAAISQAFRLSGNVTSEAIGTATGAVQSAALTQGTFERRLIRGMDMTNAQNQLEFMGDALLGDRNLGISGIRAGMARGTNDAIWGVEASRLGSYGDRAASGAKLIGAAGALIGGAIASPGTGGVSLLAGVTGAAGLTSSAISGLAGANQGTWGQLQGGNPNSAFFGMFNSSLQNNDEASASIRQNALNSLDANIAQSGDQAATIAQQKAIGLGALGRINTMAAQFRGGFATAGLWNPSAFGRNAARNTDLAGRAVGLGMAPEELQAVQIGLAGNTGVGTGASVEDAAKLALMSKSGAGSVEQLMSNVAGLSGAQGGVNDLKALLPMFENAFSAGFDKSRLAQQFVGTATSLAASLGGGSTFAAQELANASAAFGGGEYGMRRGAGAIQSFAEATNPMGNMFFGTSRMRTLRQAAPGIENTAAGGTLMGLNAEQAGAAMTSLREFVKTGGNVSDIQNVAAQDLVRDFGGGAAGGKKAEALLGQVMGRYYGTDLNAHIASAIPGDRAKWDAIQQERDALVKNTNKSREVKIAEFKDLEARAGALGRGMGGMLQMGPDAGGQYLVSALRFNSPSLVDNKFDTAMTTAKGQINEATINKNRSEYQQQLGVIAADTAGMKENPGVASVLGREFQDKNFEVMGVTKEQYDRYVQYKSNPKSLGVDDTFLAKSTEATLQNVSMVDITNARASKSQGQQQMEAGLTKTASETVSNVRTFLNCGSVAEFVTAFQAAWEKKGGTDMNTSAASGTVITDEQVANEKFAAPKGAGKLGG